MPAIYITKQIVEYSSYANILKLQGYMVFFGLKKINKLAAHVQKAIWLKFFGESENNYSTRSRSRKGRGVYSF
jgi:hypothetical protein